THAGRATVERPTATAGGSMSVVLVAQPETPVVVVEPPPKPEGSHGWSPVVFIVGASLTAVAGAFLIGSGVDTLAQRSTFDANPTQANLDAGKSDQARTNVLVGVTLGLAVLTGISAFFVDWKGSRGEHVAVGPGGISGTFR